MLRSVFSEIELNCFIVDSVATQVLVTDSHYGSVNDSNNIKASLNTMALLEMFIVKTEK